jgi:hypothetical protein
VYNLATLNIELYFITQEDLKMKRRFLFVVFVGTLLATVSVIIGCANSENPVPDPNPVPSPTTGTVTIVNQSEYDIIFVEIDDAELEADVIYEPGITIAKRGGTKSYTIDAPGKYKVYVDDANYGSTYSSVFTLQAGGSKTLIYNGTLLY